MKKFAARKKPMTQQKPFNIRSMARVSCCPDQCWVCCGPLRLGACKGCGWWGQRRVAVARERGPKAPWSQLRNVVDARGVVGLVFSGFLQTVCTLGALAVVRRRPNRSSCCVFWSVLVCFGLYWTVLLVHWHKMIHCFFCWFLFLVLAGWFLVHWDTVS